MNLGMHHVELPDGRFCHYRIQESSRTKQLRLRLSSRDGMVVIVPKGMAPQPEYLEHLIRSKSGWILRHLKRFEALPGIEPERYLPKLPGILDLAAIQEKWTVAYEGGRDGCGAPKVQVREVGKNMIQVVGGDLPEKCAALQHWIRCRAARCLPSWLDELSMELRLPYSRVTIRNQQTRWGSCTGKKSISLNCKLLLLPERWARYVLIHELCHTRVMNHGPAFWALMIRHEPQAKQIRTAMREAWRELPAWMSTKWKCSVS